MAKSKLSTYEISIGKWNSPISVTWRPTQIMRIYGIRFYNSYNEISFGRLTVRIRKPRFLQDGNGLYILRTVPKDAHKGVSMLPLEDCYMLSHAAIRTQIKLRLKLARTLYQPSNLSHTIAKEVHALREVLNGTTQYYEED